MEGLDFDRRLRALFRGRRFARSIGSVVDAAAAVIAAVKRIWLPVLIVVAITIGVFSVTHLRSVFGSDGAVVTPVGSDTAAKFNPKVVVYEVFGTANTATVNYTDLAGLPRRAVDVTLPWTLRLQTTDPSVQPNLIVQGDGQSIGCRVTVDRVVKDERTAQGVNAATYCLVKAA